MSWQPPFGFGQVTPGFHSPTPHNPRFHFHSLGGHHTVLSFIGNPNSEAGKAALRFVFANKAQFSPEHVQYFAVIGQPPQVEQSIQLPPGINFFLDYDGTLAALYKAEQPYTLVLDPMLRVLASFPLQDAPAHNEQLAQWVSRLPRLADNPPGEGLHAPVLVLPRVFEPAFCRELIALYQQHGGEESGYMREIDGKTVPVLNAGFKRRKDFNFHTGEAFAALRDQVNLRISRRLVPQIEKAFQFKATRMERYVVACYSGEDEGFFRAHRDNTTTGTKHRRFACTINLNAEEFEGGELRFPEFGRRTFRAPTGGAVVFSCSLLHEALPVTRGDRYAFLPFFYDEAGSAIRKENAGALVSEPILE